MSYTNVSPTVLSVIILKHSTTEHFLTKSMIIQSQLLKVKNIVSQIENFKKIQKIELEIYPPEMRASLTNSTVFPNMIWYKISVRLKSKVKSNFSHTKTNEAVI